MLQVRISSTVHACGPPSGFKIFLLDTWSFGNWWCFHPAGTLVPGKLPGDENRGFLCRSRSIVWRTGTYGSFQPVPMALFCSSVTGLPMWLRVYVVDFIILKISVCGWLYKSTNKRELPMKLRFVYQLMNRYHYWELPQLAIKENCPSSWVNKKWTKIEWHRNEVILMIISYIRTH